MGRRGNPHRQLLFPDPCPSPRRGKRKGQEQGSKLRWSRPALPEADPPPRCCVAATPLAPASAREAAGGGEKAAGTAPRRGGAAARAETEAEAVSGSAAREAREGGPGRSGSSEAASPARSPTPRSPAARSDSWHSHFPGSSPPPQCPDTAPLQPLVRPRLGARHVTAGPLLARGEGGAGPAHPVASSAARAGSRLRSRVIGPPRSRDAHTARRLLE